MQTTTHAASSSTANDSIHELKWIPRAAVREADAARYIGMSREFLRQSRMHGRRAGRTPGPAFVKPGRSVLYLIADLDLWLATHRRTC
jgi:hypothetical protein